MGKIFSIDVGLGKSYESIEVSEKNQSFSSLFCSGADSGTDQL